MTKEIVIVGAGFAGVSAARTLAKKIQKGLQCPYHFGGQKFIPHLYDRVA